MKKFVLLISFFAFAVFADTITVELPWYNAPEAGTIFRSADYPDGVFLYESWNIACYSCKKNAPKVNKLADYYKDNPRVHIVDIGADTKEEAYAEWIAMHETNHPVLMDPKGAKVINPQLKTKVFPTTAIVDCKGEIRWRTISQWSKKEEKQVYEMIDQILAEPGCN